jgi:hypothetical protein
MGPKNHTHENSNKMGPLWAHYSYINNAFKISPTRHYTTPALPHTRMVGWLKGFVHSRQHGPASLMKGYTIHMLVRRAPSEIAFEYNKRFAAQGIDMSDRGHLILVQDLMAQRANKPGCGVVKVNITQERFTIQRYTRLTQHFLIRFNKYNAEAKGSARYNRPEAQDTKVRFYRVAHGNASLPSQTHSPTSHDDTPLRNTWSNDQRPQHTQQPRPGGSSTIQGHIYLRKHNKHNVRNRTRHKI